MEHSFIWVLEEGLQRKLKVYCMVATSVAAAEPMEEEEDKEEVKGEEEESMKEDKEVGFSTKELASATKRATVPWVPLPTAPKFWASSPGSKAAGHGPTMTGRAWGKAPAVQVGLEPPALTDEDLVYSF